MPVLGTAQESPAGATRQTQVVLLGTGNPGADPDRSGPATAIIVNGTPYLVDFGAGIVRRAAAAVRDRGIAALNPAAFHVVFATHLHSDHTIGFPDLILSGWVAGRREPLEVYGPKGIKSMAEHLLEAYSVDIESRVKGAGRVRPEVHPHEITGGEVYKDRNVTVTAFATKHAVESYGYRFQTPDRTIVISGDTTPTQATIDACHGCDILIHQVIEQAAMEKQANLKAIAQFQTTSTQLAALASEAKPRLLVLYHAVFTTPEGPLEDMNEHYSGHVVVGRDLDVY